jgi:hypothetical protein
VLFQQGNEPNVFRFQVFDFGFELVERRHWANVIRTPVFYTIHCPASRGFQAFLADLLVAEIPVAVLVRLSQFSALIFPKQRLLGLTKEGNGT